jgi:predicted dehydrogenase
MGRKVVVGLIGAGYAAGIHARAYRKVYGVEVELRAVAASRPERAVAFAAAFGLPQARSSVQELLDDPAIDLVDICAPNSLHAELAIAAANRGKHVIVEKPLTGFFGSSIGDDTAVGGEMLRSVMESASRMVDAARENGVHLLYAENWVYAPAFQKVQRLMAASGGTILRIQGEESHSGSHASYAKRWRTAGGGSLLGKGCHPLGAALHLKREEGLQRDGRPILPRSVVAEVGQLTRSPAFIAEEPKYIKDGWQDVEDWGAMLLTFADHSVAQITASDAVLGGIRNCLAVYGSRAYAEANLNPNTACVAYAPSAETFADEYISEKIETKAGWSFPSADEEHAQGYPQEIQDFVEAVADDRPPLSDADLACDVVLVTYAAYLAAAEGRRVDLDAVRGVLAGLE